MDGGVDGGAVFAGEECGVADEQGGVGAGEHGERVGGMFDEGGIGVVEVLEEDAGVGDASCGWRRRRRRWGLAGELRRVGQPVGILDEQEDAADFVERGDGAAWDDGELEGEGSDGDKAEVGGAGVELVGAVEGDV